MSYTVSSTVTRIYKGRAVLKGNIQCIKFLFLGDKSKCLFKGNALAHKGQSDILCNTEVPCFPLRAVCITELCSVTPSHHQITDRWQGVPGLVSLSGNHWLTFRSISNYTDFSMTRGSSWLVAIGGNRLTPFREERDGGTDPVSPGKVFRRVWRMACRRVHWFHCCWTSSRFFCFWCWGGSVMK